MLVHVDHFVYEIAVQSPDYSVEDLSLLNSRSKSAIFHLTETEVITPIILYSDKPAWGWRIFLFAIELDRIRKCLWTEDGHIYIHYAGN